MNDFDRDNFEWYTNASAEELEQWYDEASTEELQYMLRLVQEELTNLKVQEMDRLEYGISFFKPDADTVLNKFRLKG